jgi:hypothetical protein
MPITLVLLFAVQIAKAFRTRVGKPYNTAWFPVLFFEWSMTRSTR